MKKIFLLAASAIVVLASCTKSQMIETPNDQKAISFDNYFHKATKATPITSGSDAEGSTISIYSYLLSNGATTSELFFLDSLKYASSAWTAGTTRYWPATTTVASPTQSLSFFAVLPKGEGTYSGDSYIALTSAMPTLVYTIPAVDKQKDVMAASKIALTNVGGATSNVQFNFKHILSQIVFSVAGEQGDGLEYTVTDIKLGNSDLKNSSTFTFSNATDGAGSWGALSGATDYTYGGANLTVNGKVATLIDASDAFMLMPQGSIATTTTLSITYSVETTGGATIYPTTTKSATVTVNWEQSKKYTYAITIPAGDNPITYSVTVAPWEDQGSTTVDMN